MEICAFNWATSFVLSILPREAFYTEINLKHVPEDDFWNLRMSIWNTCMWHMRDKSNGNDGIQRKKWKKDD